MENIRPCKHKEKYIIFAIKRSLLSTRGYISKVKYNLNDIQKYYVSLILHILLKNNPDENVRLIDMFNISIKINKSCHRKVTTYEDDNNYNANYSIIMHKIVMNLDPESSINDRYLIDNVLKNNINLEEICFSDSNVLCPKKNYEIYEKVKNRNNIVTEKKFTVLYTCPKCKEKKCNQQTVQLRSADEGCNLKIECTNCNHCWVI